MFSLAYVVLPFSDAPPAEAIRVSLARFERGRRGEVPDEWLRFHDQTAELREEYERDFSFIFEGRGLRTEGGSRWLIEYQPVVDEMRRRGTEQWTVRFADFEPNFDRFVERFANPRFERHPVTGDYGHWLNGLGHWDYWELGGRFDGRIVGERTAGRKRAQIDSGPNLVRDAIGSVEEALAEALNQDLAAEVDVEADNNIELVSRLAKDLREGADYARPGVIVLPPDGRDDGERWLHTWPHVGPVNAVEALGLAADTPWRIIVATVYERFPDHWAAGVAFHH